MKRIAICIGLNIALWGCSSVDEASQNGTTTETSAQSTSSEKELTEEQLAAIGYECKYEKNSFSRIKKKICTTAKQREIRSERSKQALEGMRANRGVVTSQTLPKGL